MTNRSQILEPELGMSDFESLGRWRNIWALLYCSGNFRDVMTGELLPDQEKALRDEFASLRSGLHFAERKLNDERLMKIVVELIEMSFEAHLAGDEKTGAHALQEAEGIIWPGSRQPVKYGIEAERRAFGKNILYAGLVASPFPREGSEADLGADQVKLLALAMKWSRKYQGNWKDFKYFSWVIDKDGAVLRTSSEPKEDEHPILRPLQRSSGVKRLKELGQSGDIRACCIMRIIGPFSDGIVTYDLEEIGRLAVSARQLFERREDGFHYGTMRYHLEESQMLPAQSIQEKN